MVPVVASWRFGPKNGGIGNLHIRPSSRADWVSVKKLKTSTTEPKPAPAVELRRDGRLARIAKALASGATITEHCRS
jgi:hypothetical protein